MGILLIGSRHFGNVYVLRLRDYWDFGDERISISVPFSRHLASFLRPQEDRPKFTVAVTNAT